ncbi:hypothetical protein EDD15DRAFT_2181381 [Pisolithus albus]|nr:hypothetical protein EDD15DRAFT_2186516 [Pisolithus albus]KAI5982227.1 hypothetical protein EDD15DRAFT_2181381 [Pisolithus albus]
MPVKILYNVSMFPASEAKKDDIKKRKGVNSYFKLESDMPFDTWKAQLLVRICDKMKPAKISFDNYDVSFAVQRVYPTPLSISSDEDYTLLLERVQKAKEPAAVVYVQEKPDVMKRKNEESASGNDSEGSETESTRRNRKKSKKKQKTRAPKLCDIDEADTPLLRNIQALRNRWVCHKKPGCESEFCFINPMDGGTHIPLTFQRLDCWAAAMLKGDATATLEMPPNHQHFKMLPDQLVGQRSVLAERRQQLEQAKSTSTLGSSSAPVVNVNFPAEMFQMFQATRMHPAHLPAPSPTLQVMQPPATNGLLSPRQLQTIGPRMSIQEFSSAFNLSPSLEKKLSEQGYISTHTLRFATVDDLVTSGILRGEIAQLRDAISCWSGSD